MSAQAGQLEPGLGQVSIDDALHDLRGRHDLALDCFDAVQALLTETFVPSTYGP